MQPELTQFVIPADDLDAALEFYTKVLNLPVKMRDGTQFAALGADAMTLSLVAPEDDITGGKAAVAFKVGDVQEAVDDAVAEGGRVLQRPRPGPHEVRALIADPSGNPIILYAHHPAVSVCQESGSDCRGARLLPTVGDQGPEGFGQ